LFEQQWIPAFAGMTALASRFYFFFATFFAGDFFATGFFAGFFADLAGVNSTSVADFLLVPGSWLVRRSLGVGGFLVPFLPISRRKVFTPSARFLIMPGIFDDPNKITTRTTIIKISNQPRRPNMMYPFIILYTLFSIL
jgi:hypothetical protein